MRHFNILALVLAVTTTTGNLRAGGQDVRACDFEVKARCASGDASVTLADGVVKTLEVNVYWCGLPGKPGYSCTIDASRGDQDSKWTDDASATLITTAQNDRVKVTVGRSVSIDLDGAKSAGNCGAGAELPRAIVIPAKKGKCRVWLGER